MSGKPSHLFKKVKCSSSKTTYKSKRTTSGLSKDTWYSNWITQKESDQTPLCCSVRSLPLQSASGNCLQNLGFIFVSERSQERHSLTWERAFGWDHCNLKSICWHPKRWWVISEGHKNSTCNMESSFLEGSWNFNIFKTAFVAKPHLHFTYLWCQSMVH